MSPRILVSRKDIPRCAKPECKKRDIHRHHVRHQHLFVMAFFETHPDHDDGGDRYVAFKRAYEEFRPEDIVYLCANHHAEIHYIYDKVLDSWRVKHEKRTKHLSLFTWEEADSLMDAFEERYKKWVKKKTRGRSAKRRWKKWYKSRSNRGP